MDLKRKLILKCETHANLGDSGPYTSILECLAELRNAVRPRKLPSAKREIAKFLRVVLGGVYRRLESHAIRGFDGVACMLYSELTGSASIDVLKRLNTNCLSYEKNDSKAVAAHDRSKVWRVVGAASRGQSARGGHGQRGRVPARRQTDFSKVRCYNCFELGHYKSHCDQPVQEQPPPQ